MTTLDFGKLVRVSTVIRMARALAPDLTEAKAVTAIHRVLAAMTDEDIVAIARTRGIGVDANGVVRKP